MAVRFSAFVAVAVSLVSSPCSADEPGGLLDWEQLPAQYPGGLGVAGPFVGIHQPDRDQDGVLILAGGANFPRPVWETDKVWHDDIFVLESPNSGTWSGQGRLPRRLAYGANVSTPGGVLCIGGCDETRHYATVFMLSWDPKSRSVKATPYPPLPEPMAYGSAALVGSTVFVTGGQTAPGLETATNHVWSLDLSEDAEPVWKECKPIPGPTRAFHLTVAQHNGYDDALYVMSGRRADGDGFELLKDVWEFSPTTDRWRRRRDVPQCVMAGTAVAWRQSHVFVLGGADGSLIEQAAELKDKHPGFPQRSFAYHTITDTWRSAGSTAANQVTTTAVRWGGSIIIPTGEVRPRVRSPLLWRVVPVSPESDFGAINYIVLFVYLLAMVGVGLWFARRNTNTDQFFRGGKSLPWWAAGCSIFATMLSSLTYTGVPSKSFAQDWVLAVGNAMIPLVAVVAVFVALPFYRRIDATSAYEYLEKRFSRGVRMFGSGSFTLFHIFRMALVMSLTGLALAIATPLTPEQSVLLMGVLSIIYCAMGGIEAVIWTDTIQTVVLLGGAMVAFALLVSGIDGGFGGLVDVASASGKLTVANYHWDATHAHTALWVIVLGGIGQNISSYTADQAVVQRYMTTPDQKAAARSIWTNALLTIPATLLFFGMGTALFVFYQAHPEKLDPNMKADQIFPLFIAREMPVGLAGLIVAGVFAAAQSTVSTSMNSTATVLITDFARPLRLCQTERGFLNAARILTVALGIGGTLLGLMFVDDSIKSLFDEFIKVIGLFMGVLGGLFVLGTMTRRANAVGAMWGVAVGAGVMFVVWKFTSVNGYLYTTIGITTCFVVGYLVSLLAGQAPDTTGLTVYSLRNGSADAKDSAKLP